MTYYVVYIFMMANSTGNINLIFSGIKYAPIHNFTAFIFFYIHKTGGCPLLIYGALIMALCHFVVGGILSSGEYIPGGVDGKTATKTYSHTVIAFSHLPIIFYALTLAPVCWVYAAEVWSPESRATGLGIAAIGNWLFNLTLGLYIPPGFRNIICKLFILFGAMCVLAAIHFFFTYPGTCDKTLEESEEMFAPGGPKPWHTKPGCSKLDAHSDEARAHSTHIIMTQCKSGEAADCSCWACSSSLLYTLVNAAMPHYPQYKRQHVARHHNRAVAHYLTTYSLEGQDYCDQADSRYTRNPNIYGNLAL
ncbi:hypothetical protein BDV11DRAFT_169460 [Aspergillus similis]